MDNLSQLSLLHIRILNALRAAPWSTVDQLARWANRSLARVYADLQLLLARRLVQRVNPRSPHFELRAVFAITDRAVRLLAGRAGMEERAYRERYAISRVRAMRSCCGASSWCGASAIWAWGWLRRVGRWKVFKCSAALPTASATRTGQFNSMRAVNWFSKMATRCPLS